MDARKLGYWATTGLGSAILTFGGISEIAHVPRIAQTMAHLGYPAFLPSLLGTWKLLAVAAILAPRLPRLKEWAYAGVFFDLTGAMISHAVAGDGVASFAPPLVIFALLAASWALRPAGRELGNAAARTTRPGAGDLVAARQLVAVSGDSVSLPDPRQLIHLQLRRFAGCPLCNLHLRSVVQRHHELVEAGIREVVVFHSTAEELRRYQAELPFAVIADPQKRLYAELGVGSSLRAVLDPRVWPAVIRGLPGDFLIASDGRVVASKYGTHAYDQWSVDEVLALAKAGREATPPRRTVLPAARRSVA